MLGLFWGGRVRSDLAEPFLLDCPESHDTRSMQGGGGGGGGGGVQRPWRCSQLHGRNAASEQIVRRCDSLTKPSPGR